jgi:hypothetical protein
MRKMYDNDTMRLVEVRRLFVDSEGFLCCEDSSRYALIVDKYSDTCRIVDLYCKEYEDFEPFYIVQRLKYRFSEDHPLVCRYSDCEVIPADSLPPYIVRELKGEN